MKARHAGPLAIALLVAGCAADPGAPPSGSPVTSASAPASAEASERASAQPSERTTPSVTPHATQAQTPAVVEHPAELLAPGSLARVTADGLRVRGGPPGTPEHEEVAATLNAGDQVTVAWTPYGYWSPEETADGRGWYQVHVGGASITSWIQTVDGWVAAGEVGLEYLEHVPVGCPAERDLENLIFSPFTGAGDDALTTPWQRLACNGDRELELVGVLDYACNEGGVSPYRFDPHLAAPQWCTQLIIDAIDPVGSARYAPGLVVRFAEFAPSDIERGDVLRVRGHFDDPAATSCTAETWEGFEGPELHVPFLILFCREQFVPTDWEILGHRDLAPLPWEVP